MQPAELIDQLAHYRLDRRLAELHYHLSRLGGATAAEVARASSRKRTDVYKDLEALVSRGFAAKTLERPSRYVPTPVEEVLRIVLEQSRDELGALGDGATALATAWPRPASRLEAAPAQYAVHQGMAQVKGCLERLVASAKEDILVVVPARFAERLRAFGVLGQLEARARDGVAVRILTAIDRPDGFATQVANGCHVRHLHFPSHASSICADARAVALLVSSGRSVSSQGADETVLLVESPDFVLGQRSLLDGLWQRGIEAKARWRELQRGQVAPRLEVLRGARLVADRVSAMAARAQVRLGFDAPSRAVQPMAAWLEAAVASAAARGVRVEPLARAVPAVTHPLAGLPGAPTDVPCQATVDVDGAEFAFAWQTESSGPDGEGAECWGIWTNDRILGQRLCGAGASLLPAAAVPRP